MQDYQILLCEDFHVEEDMTQDRYNFDGTGKITTNDAHILRKYIANPSSVTSAQKRKIEAEYGGFKAGDINRDGIINNLDANLLLKFASGIINEETADIPIIFLTGVTEKMTVIETLTELMPQGYVVKPAKKSELVAKIIDVLG